MKEEFFGLILNGGKSSRMGKEKGMIDYHGKPQIYHLMDILNEFSKMTFISVKSFRKDLDIPQIPDLLPLSTPINGIYSALKTHPDKNWIILSCDMPFISENTINFLIKKWDNKVDFTGFWDSEGEFPDPMIGIWSAGILSKIEEFVRTENSPRKFILQNQSNLSKPPNEKWLININTREQFEQAKKLLS